MECLSFLLVTAVAGGAFWLIVKLITSLSAITALQQKVDRLDGDVQALRKYASMLRDLVESYARSASGSPPEAEAAPSESISEVIPSTAPPPDVIEPAAEGPSGADVPEPEETQAPIEPTVPPTVLPHVPIEQDEPQADLEEERPAARVRVEEERPPATPSPVRNLDTYFDGINWENFVGIKLFSAIAGVALVLAAVFFLKYSVERGWLGPEVRAAIGLITGATLIVVCEARVARNYRVTANAMHGAGIAILYATLFAVHALWHLVPAAVVFGLMLLVTAVAVMLSIRRDSVFIAVLGMLGGFATPALLSTGENRPIGLFSYLLLLNVGLSWVAYRKRWVALTFGSLVLTVLYQWAWVAKFLDAAQFPLAAGIFLIFGLTGAASLWIPRLRSDDDSGTLFDRVSLTSAVLPFAFGIFAAAVPAYGHRFHTLFGFLLLVAAGLIAVALKRNREWLYTLAAAAVVIAFAVWFAASYTSAAWPLLLAWHAAYVVLFAAVATRRAWIGNLAAPALLFVFVLLPVVEKQVDAGWMFFGALLLELAVVTAVALWWRRPLLYFTGAGFALVAQGVWAARLLTSERLVVGLLAFCAFGLFMLAVPAVARKLERPLQPVVAPLVTSVASLLLLLFLTSGTLAASSLWGLAVILGLLLVGTIREARIARDPVFGAVAIVLAWIILATWWSNAPIIEALIPGLVVVAATALVVLLTSAMRIGGAAMTPAVANAAYLALVAHVFLLNVALQPSLSLPPWPLFATLALVDLACGISAIVHRRPTMLTAAAVGSEVILFAWSTHINGATWPLVALGATAIVAAWTLLWLRLTRRVASGFEWPAFAALLLAHAVAITAGTRGGEPILVPLLLLHVALAIATAALAWRTRWHEGVVLSSVATAFAVGLAPLGDAGLAWKLAFATPVYAIYIAYALLLGARAGRSLFPHLAAIFASASYFFVARAAIVDAGYGWMIGVLPVVQAIVMLTVLVRVLRTDTAETRDLTRLAVVAGTALAFITVAIPLQLDKQWITVAWALEGAALVWLFRKIPHRGLLLWGGGLLAISFVRLTMNPAIFTYDTSTWVIFNWYLYTYIVTAAALFAAARWLPEEFRIERTAAAVGGTVLLFVLLNIEIADFFSPRGGRLDFVLEGSLAQNLTYTIGWAAFAVALLIAGIVMNTKPARIAALALLLITILKCFLMDLDNLTGLYRVGSLVGLAFSLVAVGVLIQRFVISRSRAEVIA